MRLAIAFIIAILMAPLLGAEQLDETVTVPWLIPRKPLTVRPDTKAAPDAQARLHFWVGKDGNMEATEEICGDRELFDDIVDAVLDWEFKHEGAFTTDLTFVRRGKNVVLLLELPPESRPKKDVCADKQ